MSIEIPKFHETFNPILNVLKDGVELPRAELTKKVCDSYYSDLPSELLSKKISNGYLIHSRINWGVSYLKQGKFLEHPRRGIVKITSKGLKILESGGLTLSQLKKDSDYTEHQISKEKKEQEAEQSQIEISDKDYTPQDMIESGFDSIRQNIKADLLERLKAIDPFYFEKVILILLKKMGYGEFIETKKTGDGGIDGIINQDQLGINKIYIQAKRYAENKVREKDIRNFIGAMSGDTSNGVFVTTSTFDDGAIEKSKQAHHKIILIDGNRLTELMFNFGVGVQTITSYDLKRIDEDFFEDSQ